MQVCRRHARVESIQFGIVPGNRKRNGRVEKSVEVVRVMRVLPEVIGIYHNGLADLLLKTGIELITISWAYWCTGSQSILLQSARARCA